MHDPSRGFCNNYKFKHIGQEMTDPIDMPRKVGREHFEPTAVHKALSRNLKERGVGGDDALVNVRALAVRSGVSHQTIYDMLDMSRDVRIGNIEKVARVLALEAWSLLLTRSDAEVLEFIAVFNNTDEIGREIIKTAVHGAKQRIPISQRRPKDDSAT